MGERKECSTLKLKDSQIESSWIPNTPAKPGLAEKQPICKENLENRSSLANWLHLGLTPPPIQAEIRSSLVPGDSFFYQQEIQAQTDGYFRNQSLGFASEGSVCRDSSLMYSNYCNERFLGIASEGSVCGDASLMYANYCNERLMQLTNAAASAAAGHRALHVESSYTASASHYQVEGVPLLAGPLFSSWANEKSLLPESRHEERNTLGVDEDTSWLPFVPSLSHQAMMGAGLRADILYHPAGVTPNLTTTANKEKAFDATNFCVDEAVNETDQCIAKEAANETDQCIAKEADEDSTHKQVEHDSCKLQKDGQSESPDHISCSATSKTLQENHEPDMGSNQDVDLKTPQQKPKRKKHRPKVIRTDQPKRNCGSTKIAQSEKSAPDKRKYTRKNTASTQGNTALNGKIGTDPVAEDMQRPKRMCVQRKGIYQQASTPLEEDISEITCPQTNHTTRKSCRRSLSFDSYSLASERSLCQPVSAKTNSQNSCAEDQMHSMRKLGKGLDVMIEMTGTDRASDLTQTPKKYLEEYLSMEETNTPCPSTPVKCDQLVSKLMAGSSNGYLRGKCQVVFSNTSHDKELSILNARTPVDQCAARNPDISDCSRMLTQEGQAGGRKRGRPSSNNVSDSCCKTAVWVERNSLQKCSDIRQPIEYCKILQTLHFPAICKKKRTERVYKPTTSCMLPTVSLTNCYVQNKAPLYKNSCREASPSSFGTMQVHCSRSRISRNDNIQLERTNLNYSSLGIPKPLTKKRSKGLTRPRDLASLDRLLVMVHGSSSKLALPDVQSVQYLQTCRKALVAGTPPKLITKKRSKRYVLGFSSALTSECLPSVDAIVQQFSRLDIAAECNTLANLETNLLAACHYEYHGRNAVVNRIGWTMIPFGALYDYNRRHRPRPKVELDEETTRVWKLLLEDINNEGVDGTDEENRKRWQKERRVFRGRANTFISKMRLVQGDRRFRPWKGSVVDSVVGVFLTQNVSDHLSSSAFMSMAARFPLKPSSNEDSSFEGIIDTNNLLYLQNICGGDDSAALPFMKNNRRNDRQSFFRNLSEEDIKSTDNLRFPTSDSSECGPSMLTEINICKFDAFNDDANVRLDDDQRAFDEALSSQNYVVSPHNSVDSAGQIIREYQLCTNSVLGEESTSKSCKDTSFLKLMQMQEHGFDNSRNRKEAPMVDTLTNYDAIEGNWESMRSDDHDHEKVKPAILSSCLGCINIDSVDADRSDFEQILASCLVSNLGGNEHFTTEQSGMSEESAACSVGISFDQHKHSCENHISADDCPKLGDNLQRELVYEVQEQKNDDTTRELTHTSTNSEGTLDSYGSTSVEDETINSERRAVESDASSYRNLVESTNVTDPFTLKTKKGKSVKGKQSKVNWDKLREQAHAKCKRDKTASTMDSVDWEAVRCAEVGEIAETIKERGMNNMLAERIKDFLNRLIRDHERIDLEWLRDVPPDKAKEYLLSFRGLGLKSVECVRLLTLHQVAFPVDTNVGRIAVRLGWVPLQPLPESLQLHLLEMYPVLESIQKYLWPRLCKLDQRKLYELHYQMITFGKVFCTKNKPNCNSCPMRGECRHFASAYASARLALPAPEDRRIVTAKEDRKAYTSQAENLHHLQLPTPEFSQHLVDPSLLTLSQPTLEVPATPKPIIEEPETPELEPIIEEPETPELEPIIEEFEIESESTQFPVDIEDMFLENDDEIPTIVLNIEALNRNVQNIIQNNAALQESEKSQAVVAITPEAASIPMPKLKNINRLRTEHQVYIIPDSHELLKGLDNREQNDPSPYLLAIWSPGETINSVQPPERRCSIRESGQLCFKDTCFSCNSIREATSQTVRGTILIPCRTAMRGRFPLNGTYFQVNEVFADHESSLNPINIPRNWLWNLRRRTVYFGTSIPTIFKGLGPLEIQHCFWRGFVCVRGFDRLTRSPRPLIARLHFPASKLAKYRETAKSTLPRYMSD